MTEPVDADADAPTWIDRLYDALIAAAQAPCAGGPEAILREVPTGNLVFFVVAIYSRMTNGIDPDPDDADAVEVYEAEFHNYGAMIGLATDELSARIPPRA